MRIGSSSISVEGVVVRFSAIRLTNTRTTGELLAQQQMSLSSGGLDLIKGFEGYRDKVYNDVAGNPTIGYGHLIKKGEDFSKGITEPQASALLAQDAQGAVNAVNSNLTASVSQNQFDALVSFTYNVGAQGFANSTLLANINSGKDVTLGNFTAWDHAGGKEVAALTRRRTSEYNLFSKGTTRADSP